MSDNGSNGTAATHRRSSITQAALSNLFQRNPSNGNGSLSGPSNGAADPRGRRLSVTTIGLSGTSPTNPATFGRRRGSISTNSSIDESAIDDDDGQARSGPNTPFVRRMSFGASGSGANNNSTMRGYRPSGSPGNGNTNPTSPPAQLGRKQSTQKSPPTVSAGWSASASSTGRRPSSVLSSSLPQASFTMHPRATSDNPVSRADQQGFNWSEQLRSRAESSVSAASRQSFSFGSPPRAGAVAHDRTRSVSDMPQPPAQAPTVPQQPRQEKPKPDAFQERILKGDFYMD